MTISPTVRMGVSSMGVYHDDHTLSVAMMVWYTYCYRFEIHGATHDVYYHIRYVKCMSRSPIASARKPLAPPAIV